VAALDVDRAVQGYLLEEPGMTTLAGTDLDPALGPLQAEACTYRIAFGPRAGQKVLTLQTVPSQEAPPPNNAVSTRRALASMPRSAAPPSAEDPRTPVPLHHRPAIANEHLTLNCAGQVVLTLKAPYRDGTPLEFMQRLAALVLRRRRHLRRFHGVLAPNAKRRAEIIPDAPVNANDNLANHGDAPPPSVPTHISWARLLTKPPGAVLNGERRPKGRKPEKVFINECSLSTWNTVPSAAVP